MNGQHTDTILISKNGIFKAIGLFLTVLMLVFGGLKTFFYLEHRVSNVETEIEEMTTHHDDINELKWTVTELDKDVRELIKEIRGE